MKAFLLAAGLGTRLGELTRETPKCLLPVGGRPLLDRWFEMLAAAGVEEVLVNTHWLAERVREHVEDSDPPLAVRLVFEPALLGSAGTLAANREFVDGDEAFLVVYADNASSADLGPLRARDDDAIGTIGLYRAENPRACGIVELDGEGRVIGFEEKPSRPRSPWAWAGLLWARPAVLDAIPDRVPADLGHDVLPRLVGRLRGVEITGYHRDIGTPESYRRACEELA